MTARVAPDPARAELLDRLRSALEDRLPREVRMFGGISFMIDGRMIAAARRHGELLLRIGPANSERLLGDPFAQPARMGPSRTMERSWIAVSPEGLTGQRLTEWLTLALSFHASQASQNEQDSPADH